MKRDLKLEVASPCTESWDDMQGDDRIRHCARCQLNVYNIHEFTLPEVESLMRSRNGRMCVRLFQRADGTVLTRDCPVGLRKVRLRIAASLVTAAAFVGAVLTAALQPGGRAGLFGFQEHFQGLKTQVHQWPIVGPAVKRLEPPDEGAAAREAKARQMKAMLRNGGLNNTYQ
jgi:hypothetical protein